MNSCEVAFTINEIEKIVIKFEDCISQINCCSSAPIFFIKGEEKYLLSDDSICFKLENFQGMLRIVLLNKLVMHESLSLCGSIKHDIGYVFNEYWQDKHDFIGKDHRDHSWVGHKYMVWGKKAIAWLYNDCSGNIIFEITPLFPGKRTLRIAGEPFTQEEIENSLWYEEWIKSYKPILIRTIPREVAERWLKQANELLEIIENNIERMLSDGNFYNNHDH